VSEFSDEERIRLAMREMLAVDPGSGAFTDPSEIRKDGGWRWRHRIDLKVVVAVAAVVILVATLVLAGPLRPGPNKQRVSVTNPTVTSTTPPPSTSLPVVTTVPTTTVPIDTAISVYGDCTSPSVEPAEVVLTCADDGEVLMGLHWASWTAASASAVGTLVYNDCNPDCATGQHHSVPGTTVTLTVPIRGADGILVWSEVKRTPSRPGMRLGLTTAARNHCPHSRTNERWPNDHSPPNAGRSGLRQRRGGGNHRSR
jgi:hypothetical protein